MDMVPFSTPESFARGRISRLAILETILSVIAALVILVNSESLSHLTFSVCIAPLILLRTELSTLIEQKLFYYYVASGIKFKNLLNKRMILLVVCFLLIVPVAFRIMFISFAFAVLYLFIFGFGEVIICSVLFFSALFVVFGVAVIFFTGNTYIDLIGLTVSGKEVGLTFAGLVFC